MKILVLSHTRCGSTTLCKWISKELSFDLDESPYNSETFNSVFDGNNIIRKIVVEEYYPSNSDINKFDKVIYLSRDNSVDAAISFIFANRTDIWHNSYEVTDEWIQQNKTILLKCANNYEVMKSRLKSYRGFHTTYENIFINKQDIASILAYLNIEKAIHLNYLEINKKYRKDNNVLFKKQGISLI